MEINLEFLARQNERIINELGYIREAIEVLTAIANRHENSIGGVAQELKSIHRLNARFHDRLLKLEGE